MGILYSLVWGLLRSLNNDFNASRKGLLGLGGEMSMTDEWEEKFSRIRRVSDLYSMQSMYISLCQLLTNTIR